jgi:hypothetical protein
MKEISDEEAWLSLGRKLGELTSSKKIKPLPREEWDFSGCSRWERTKCECYEIWREHKEVWDRIFKCRQDYIKWQAEHHGRDNIKFDYKDSPCPSWVWRDFPEFPKTPWMAIPETIRKERVFPQWEAYLKRIEQYDAITASVQKLKDVDGVYRDSITEVVGETSSYYTYQVFGIYWGKSDSVLQKRFSEWLRKNRPKDAEPVETRGNTVDRNFLKCLGALRLLRHCGGNWKLAAQMSVDAFPDDSHAKPLYSNQTAWSRAAEVAADRIQPI